MASIVVDSPRTCQRQVMLAACLNRSPLHLLSPAENLLASTLVVPAMLSKAELSTAMPRAGGDYYFLDRSMGPMAGTVGGFGTWLSLVFKSAFALIGMGAYLHLFLDVPIEVNIQSGPSWGALA